MTKFEILCKIEQHNTKPGEWIPKTHEEVEQAAKKVRQALERIFPENAIHITVNTRGNVL